jgi:exosome complex component RRP46
MLGLLLAWEVSYEYSNIYEGLYIDWNVAPRERHLETLLYNTLRSIILTRLIPRTLVQITLQVRSLPEEDTSAGANTSLTLLPHLLHTAFLSLLSASIPLSTTLTSVLVAYPSSTTKSATPLLTPTANELLRAKPIRSTHVFAFSGDRRLLLNESDGKFSYEEWEEACEMAEEVCCKEEDQGGVSLGDSMEVDGAVQSQNLEKWLRQVVKRKVEYEQRWKSAT